MCPYGYHHSGFMATPALYIYIYIIPVSPEKNLSKIISQIRSNLNSAHLDMIYIYIYIYIYIDIYN